MRFISTILLMLLAGSSFAQEAVNINTSSCAADLNSLILSNFKTKINKADISVELQKNDNGSYEVWLYNNKIAPNPKDPNKQSVGFLTLNINENYLYDGKKEEDLHLDKGKIKSFADKCLRKKFAGNFEITSLPIRLEGDDGYGVCEGHSYSTNKCGQRYFEYQLNEVPSYIADQIKSEDLLIALPSVSGLDVFLASNAQSEETINYYLYIFKGKKLITHDMVGSIDNDSTFAFDISKDYVVTTYSVVNEKKSSKTKQVNVSHMKLADSGKLVLCQKSNPTCN